MPFEKQYRSGQSEEMLASLWQKRGIYRFSIENDGPLYVIDTPPPTVSGKLHIGHVYSYSHADFIARFRRMRGENVFYPMGFDDNGLPTERLVEQRLGRRAMDLGRFAFVEQCLRVSEEEEAEYRRLWERLGLSIDWRYTYRTIDTQSRRCAQASFIDLYKKGLVYRAEAPSIWCPECRASFAQADLEDHTRTSEFVTLPFWLEDGRMLPVATTRPELLAACVAVFVHPDDPRYREFVGIRARLPLYERFVTVLADPKAEPTKGTGAVMCCTFGDAVDVEWQRAHHLPFLEAIDGAGKMTDLTAGALTRTIAGLPVEEARAQIKTILNDAGLILSRQPVEQSIRVHERCGTPVEYRVAQQWFVRLLDQKDTFLNLGDQICWHPEHMRARYRAWVENLNWDWCISRQRFFGVPFPVWYCAVCGQAVLASTDDLPVDPMASAPPHPCSCGETEFVPDPDVMDTWATSSLSPQILAGWLEDPARFAKLYPATMRPQAHEIIRTWAFYTIVKSWYHFGCLPWQDVFISGWAIAGEGMGKISKSKGGGPLAPLAMIERYSADALRYWAASTSPGKDAVISEDKINMGVKLTTKLWNVARFAEPFVHGLSADSSDGTLADHWIRASSAALTQKVTALFENYEYAGAKAEIEAFFWRDLADNYIEMAKQRLYDPSHPGHLTARLALRHVLKRLLKLLAPLLPFVTETVWQELFAGEDGGGSIHLLAWPDVESQPEKEYLSGGEALIAIATATRRYKSEHALALSSPIARLEIESDDLVLAEWLENGVADLSSVTRAVEISIGAIGDGVQMATSIDGLRIGIIV